MSVNAKDFRLPLQSKNGVFSLHVELQHKNWDRDVADLQLEIHDLVKCKRQIEKVVITQWACYDELDKLRGKNTDLELDITDWFMGPRGPVNNPKTKGVGFAFVINQKPTLRTPWVKDVRMDVHLVINYTAGTL